MQSWIDPDRSFLLFSGKWSTILTFLYDTLSTRARGDGQAQASVCSLISDSMLAVGVQCSPYSREECVWKYVLTNYCSE